MQQSLCSSLLQDLVHSVSDGTLTFWKQTGTGPDQIKLPGGGSVMAGCGAGTRTSWLSRDAASEDRGTFGRVVRPKRWVYEGIGAWNVWAREGADSPGQVHGKREDSVVQKQDADIIDTTHLGVRSG